MRLATWPLFDALQDASSILLTGAGGGFDIYSGLPLYFALKDAGKDVHLANLTFAPLPQDERHQVTASCFRVTADTPYSQSYFPEFQLSSWFRERHGQEIPVYAFERTGVISLQAAYRRLHNLLALDAVVLVDGGTDSLMRGDEVGLGTPEEDVASIAAVTGTEIPHQYLACIGFGVDSYHGVCHAHFLESVSALAKNRAFLGVATVLADMPEGVEFLAAVEYANYHTPLRPSIVANSIASAVEGEFGDHHRTTRTMGSRLWINPLMPIYWAFDLPSVAERNLYIDLLRDTNSIAEVAMTIATYRQTREHRPWEDIPT